MSGHTPGPWATDMDGLMVWGMSGQMRVADVRGFGHLTGKGTMGLSDEEAIAILEANARLIAAAPDMAEALREIAEQGCCFSDRQTAEHECWRLAETIPNVNLCSSCIARAALAKAGLG